MVLVVFIWSNFLLLVPWRYCCLSSEEASLLPSRHNTVDSTYIIHNYGTLIICSLSVANVATEFVHLAHIFNHLLLLSIDCLHVVLHFLWCTNFILVTENMPRLGLDHGIPRFTSERFNRLAIAAVVFLC